MTSMNYDPTNAHGSFGSSNGSSPLGFATQQGYVTKVFNWMFMGLLASGVTAYIAASNPMIIKTLYSNMFVLIVLGIGCLALVWNLSANINKMSPEAAATNFFVYAALNGLLLSSIFLVYTSASIFSTFCIAALLFGVMAAYGAITKQDLSGLGSLMFMALIGLIIAQVVNMFMQSSAFDSIINYAGVLIFIGLTAYDMQKIKQIGQSTGYNPSYAIVGALALYLDFINLFLYLLRILGDRRRD